MALTLGDAILYLRADQSDLDRELKKTRKDTEGWANRLGNSIGAALKVAAKVGAAGVAILGGALVKAVAAGSDVEEMMGKFNVVFGEFAGGTIEALDDMAVAMRRNRFDLRSYAATFQDTFVPLGFARDEAATLSEELTRLTVDMASFNNVAESEVLASLQSALVGNHETMRAYGVIITQATLEQELFNMGIAGGIKEATEMEKVLARMNLIMAGTSDAQGDAERTALSWANTMRGLQAAISETFADIGMQLLPRITPILNTFSDFVREQAPRIATGFANMLDEIDLAMAKLRTAWVLNLGGMRGAWDRFQTDIVPQVRSLWRQLLDIFTKEQKTGERNWDTWLKKLIQLWEGFANMAMAILQELLRVMRGAQLAWQGLTTGDWRAFWTGFGEIFEAALDAFLHQLEYVFGPVTRNRIVDWLHFVWFEVTRIAREIQQVFSSMFRLPTLPPLLQGILGGPGAIFQGQGAGQSVTNNNFAVSVTGVAGDASSVARSSRDGVLSAARRIGL